MALCREYQIPHSHFLGGPNRWTELDREKAVDYELVLREQCPRCGTLPEEWVDEKGRPLDEPLMTPVLRHCQGCEEVEKMESKKPKGVKGAYVAIIPFAHLEDDDDELFDPTKDPDTIQRAAEEELARARSMGG
jgi:hypothetical protein